MTYVASAAARGATRVATQLQSGGWIEGYASIFDSADLSRDVVAPGAFRETLRRRGSGGVRMLYQHDVREPIGVWEILTEDARGLFVRGRLAPGVARAREVEALIRAGALDGLSIGFRVLKAHREARAGVRRIEAADLWEISVVTFPMQPRARILARSRGLSLPSATQ